MAASRTRQGNGVSPAAVRRSMGAGGAYIQGNTVRKPNVEIPNRQQPARRPNHATRKNRDRARHMNLGYVLFLAAALTAAGFILISYIGLQADITNSVKNISRLESQLNDLKQMNDEEYSRVTSSVDLEEVKRIAIQELGMKYAEEGQVVTFSGGGGDYVRQMADIPEIK